MHALSLLAANVALITGFMRYELHFFLSAELLLTLSRSQKVSDGSRMPSLEMTLPRAKYCSCLWMQTSPTSFHRSELRFLS